MSDNSITVVGNLTRECELRFTPSGAANLKVGVAVNRRWQNKQTNEWEEAVSFFDVVAWRDLAEHASESLKKGDRVVVTGRLEQRSWEADDGSKRYATEIIADDIAPSLRWATAKVSKVERQQGSGQGSSQRQAPAPAYDDSDEPF